MICIYSLVPRKYYRFSIYGRFPLNSFTFCITGIPTIITIYPIVRKTLSLQICRNSNENKYGKTDLLHGKLLVNVYGRICIKRKT